MSIDRAQLLIEVGADLTQAGMKLAVLSGAVGATNSGPALDDKVLEAVADIQGSLTDLIDAISRDHNIQRTSGEEFPPEGHGWC